MTKTITGKGLRIHFYPDGFFPYSFWAGQGFTVAGFFGIYSAGFFRAFRWFHSLFQLLAFLSPRFGSLFSAVCDFEGFLLFPPHHPPHPRPYCHPHPHHHTLFSSPAIPPFASLRAISTSPRTHNFHHFHHSPLSCQHFTFSTIPAISTIPPLTTMYLPFPPCSHSPPVPTILYRPPAHTHRPPSIPTTMPNPHPPPDVDPPHHPPLSTPPLPKGGPSSVRAWVVGCQGTVRDKQRPCTVRERDFGCELLHGGKPRSVV